MNAEKKSSTKSSKSQKTDSKKVKFSKQEESSDEESSGEELDEEPRSKVKKSDKKKTSTKKSSKKRQRDVTSESESESEESEEDSSEDEKPKKKGKKSAPPSKKKSHKTSDASDSVPEEATQAASSQSEGTSSEHEVNIFCRCIEDSWDDLNVTRMTRNFEQNFHVFVYIFKCIQTLLMDLINSHWTFENPYEQFIKRGTIKFIECTEDSIPSYMNVMISRISGIDCSFQKRPSLIKLLKRRRGLKLQVYINVNETPIHPFTLIESENMECTCCFICCEILKALVNMEEELDIFIDKPYLACYDLIDKMNSKYHLNIVYCASRISSLIV